MREFHLRDAPCVSVESLPEELRFSRHARAFSFYGTLNQPNSSVDPGLAPARNPCSPAASGGSETGADALLNYRRPPTPTGTRRAVSSYV
ncbi:hypothetical protein JCM10369A_15300 [Nocardioides pyridinolyticus]